jgi:DNA-binding NtrC family response regulator
MSCPGLKLIDEANEAHHIREIFNRSIAYLADPEVQKAILGRIETLVNGNEELQIKATANAQKIRDLRALQEDVELEIEHRDLLRANAQTKSTNAPAGQKFMTMMADKDEELKKLKADTDLIRSIEVMDDSGLLAKMEYELILKTLKACNGNRAHTARVLGISVRTLRNKLNHYIHSK